MSERTNDNSEVSEYAQFRRCLARAAAKVPSDYVRVPVSGGGFALRERAYCYELYHQVRAACGDAFGHTLMGELDKRGNPAFRALTSHASVPDLLLHRPGSMEANLIAVEVKACGAATTVRCNARGLP